MKKIIYILFLSLISNLYIFADSDSLILLLESAKEDTNKVNILNNISYEIVWDDPDQAMVYAKEALELSKTLNFKKGIAFAYKNIGLNYFAQGLFNQSLTEFFNSIKTFDELGNKYQVAKLYNNIGLIFHYQGQYNKAFEYYNKSLKTFEQIGDKKEIAKSLNQIGAIYYEQGNLDKSLNNYFKCLKFAEEIKDTTLIAIINSNIGQIYNIQENYKKGLEYYFLCLKLQEAIDDKRGMVYTYFNIGNTYQTISLNFFEKENNIDSAIINIEKSKQYNLLSLQTSEFVIDINAKIAAYNKLGENYYNIGEYELKKRNIKNAEDNFHKALEYLFISLDVNKDFVDKQEVAISNQGIGNVKLLQKKYSEAVLYLNIAKTIGKESGNKNIIKDAAEILAKTYPELKQYKKAYENHVLYKQMSDSLKNDENIKKVTQLGMQFEFDKIQKQQEFEKMKKELAHQAEMKKQNLIKTFYLIGLAIVILFAFVVYRSYKRKQKDNILLEEQNEKIEEQKQSITDSIQYASRIQKAVVPSEERANEILPEHFILWRPRDIVSGDFWWMTQKENKVILVAADCTGHGVPGAFMSMLGVSFLNEIVNQQDIITANVILNQLRTSVKTTLKQKGAEGEAKDGMDIALVVLDVPNMKLQFSGAYNPLYLYRNSELIETKADKNPIGIFIKEKDSFTNHEIELQKGDTFYIFSDGFIDQFGGEKGGKFKTKNFKALLQNMQDKPMKEQGEILDRTVDEWRGDIEQIDDIIILGVRI
ncbi:MAG: tetratricopeptide repeat protein [Bacteroidales bacterium]|nr:tetratricopeptide repeat protein [Bacteroidales bacterium]